MASDPQGYRDPLQLLPPRAVAPPPAEPPTSPPDPAPAPQPATAPTDVPAPDPAPGPVAATALGGEKVLSSDLSAGSMGDREAALLAGTRLHLLLEHLPGVSPEERAARARDLLAGSEGGLPTEAELSALLEALSALLEAEDAAHRLRLVTDLLRSELKAMNVIRSLPATEVARTRWSPNRSETDDSRRWVMAPIRVRRASKSRSACTVHRPMPSALRRKFMAPPVAIIAFEGMQSHRWAAPPTRSRSTRVTSAPKRAAVVAAWFPAGPPPMITKRCGMV